MATVRDSIIRSFKLSHILGAGETLTDEEMTDSFDLVNGLIDQANLDKLFIPWETETVFQMQANKNIYTIGPAGADVISARPLEILFAFSRRANNVDLPMFVTHQKIDYDRIQKKNITIAGWEQVLYYQASWPLGTLYFYMIPLDNSSEVHLTYKAQFAAFATVNDTINMPPLYSTWLKYKLAERLCPEYGVTWSNENKNVLTEVESTLKRNNIKPFPVTVGDLAELGRVTGEKYNVYADTTTRN